MWGFGGWLRWPEPLAVRGCGAITVAVTGQQNMAGTAAQLSTFLHADRILKASYTLADGAHLQQVWYRPAAPSGA